MVKFYTHHHTYAYPFSTVSLAYFLRYPNPYSTHVLTCDVLSRHLDPLTGRLHTTRLLLKRSRLPSAVMKLLPRSMFNANAAGDSQSYVLEESVVDVREGWMRCETRNLEFTKVLSVVERHEFRRPASQQVDLDGHMKQQPQQDGQQEYTDVLTSVKLRSRLGQRIRDRLNKDGDEATANMSTAEMLRNWSQTKLQRSIEAIGLRRTSASQPRAIDGMQVVLERLRQGGLVEVLEGMRRDRMGGSAVGGQGNAVHD